MHSNDTQDQCGEEQTADGHEQIIVVRSMGCLRDGRSRSEKSAGILEK